MPDEKNRKTGRPLGPTGEIVRANIVRCRGRMPVTELSRKLRDIGRDIPPLGLRRIEEGSRRVDVDDLVAIAVALDVSPATLLVPDSDVDERLFAYTGIDSAISGRALWNWVTGLWPLPPHPPTPIKFLTRALPSWRLNELAPGLAAGEEDPDAAERELRRQSRKPSRGNDQ